MCRFRWSTAILLGCVFCAASGISTPAQGFTTLVNFDGTDGEHPTAGVIQGTDGNFYGTAPRGGANSACQGLGGCGTVFKLTPAGAITTLYNFCSQPNCADGWYPSAALVQGTDGNFYGTTSFGGTFGSSNETSSGTVFRITPAGVLTTLYSFCSSGAFCNDGSGPSAPLVQGADGNFYGTTLSGGFAFYCSSPQGCGTVFMITPTGVENTIYSFCSQPNCTDGFQGTGGLVRATDGNFYGTTWGGAGNVGTAFEITPAGALTTLHTFDTNNDGAYPMGPLLQATNGNFYGVTSVGGANGQGTIFEMNSGGAGGNALNVIYNFCPQSGCPDGAEPQAGLVQASDGNLYGTTLEGGAASGGTIFEITTGGTLTLLYSFCSQPNCADGEFSTASLLQANNGRLYGTTPQGGNSSICTYCGTIFSLPGPVKIPASSAGCNGVYNGVFNGNLTISLGEKCEFRAGGVTGSITMTGGSLTLTNATIGGTVLIQGASTFALGPSLTIQGDLQIQNLVNGAAANTICGATVAGNLQFQNDGTPLQMGYPSSCVGNRVGGYLQVGNNNAPAWLVNNAITGSLQDQNNSAATVISNNTVGGNLQVQNNGAATQVSNNAVLNTLSCQNNRSITGGGNTARQRQGQCARF